MASSSSSGNHWGAPCAACKFLRRKCLAGCVFAPYFPPEEPQKFINVHKIFGASNVSKLLNEVQPHQREDAVTSLAYEAEARLKDPVHGCVGAISFLQAQVQRLQKELEATNAHLIHYANTALPDHHRQPRMGHGGAASSFYHNSAALSFPYNATTTSPWDDINPSTGGGSYEEGGEDGM